MQKWQAIGLIGLAFLALWALPSRTPPQSPVVKVVTPGPGDPVFKTAAEHRFEVARAVAAATAKQINDPDSLVWEDLYTNADATVVCAVFRAKNVFGAMVRKRVSSTTSKTYETPEAWNRLCTGSGFFSEKSVAEWRSWL